LTALLAGILERRAIRLARSLITTNNALFLLLAIRTLRPAGLGVGPATCLAGFGLTDLDLSRAWILAAREGTALAMISAPKRQG